MNDNRLEPSGGESDRRLSRRNVLAAAGGLAVAGTLAACGSSSSGSSATSSASTAAGTPKRGGNFRVGVTGGGSKDIIDGQNALTKVDQARLVSGWETLLVFDEQFKLTNDGLASEVTQDNPTQWTIVLKDGIEFNNGKTLDADDVIYSIQRILDPDLGNYGATGLASVDPNGMTKLDAKTVRMKLKSADSTIGDQFGQYFNGIVPKGYQSNNALKYVGTGAYITKSFNPGQQSVHTRNPNYWRSGEPYFDQVTVIDFPDPSAQVNALRSGQLDAVTDVSPALTQTVKSDPSLGVLISEGGGWVPICMRIDTAPFDNPKVRQAMRLIVDRKAMVEQVLSGYGRIANDLYSPFDSCYDTSLPQREQDIEQAKSLLKSAGMSDLSIDLHTTDGSTGMVDTANVFAAQAKAAGVNINVKNDPNYYGDQYLKLAFSIDFWGTRNYLAQVAAGSLPTSPYNETKWPPKTGTGSNYIDLYNQALSAVDETKRCEIIHEMQSLEYNYGGYVIPFFNSLVDGYSAKVKGLKPSKATLNLNSYGNGYRTIWFA